MRERGLSVGVAPHVFEVRPAFGTMWIVSACLFAPILQSSLTDGFSSLATAALSVAAALATETLISIYRGSAPVFRAGRSPDGSVVVSALILALLLPSGIHPIVPVAGAVFTVLVVRNSFGGLGANWLNPAVGAWLFLRFTWAPAFDSALAKSPLSLLASSISKGVADPSGSPLAVLKIAGWKPSQSDARITSWLNDTFLSALGAELPSGYIDLLSLSAPGSIVDRGVIVLLCATVVLLASGAVRWRFPLAFIISYLVSTRLWGGLPYGGGPLQGDMLFALFTGGIPLVAYVMVADPGTGCKTWGAGVVAAAFAGLLSFWFRFNGGDAYGALLAIPVTNLLVAMFRIVERRFYFSKRGSE